MKKINAIYLIPILFVSAIFTSCSEPEVKTEEPVDIVVSEPSEEELIAMGAQLVKKMGCHDCHSPKMMTKNGLIPDPERILSGFPQEEVLAEVNPELMKDGNWILMNQGITAFVGPWGTSYSANLTSDATGIGNWTEEAFKIAITEGWYKGIRDGRKLLPPMPWQNLTDLADEEIHAMYTYLQSTTPVNNVVPPPVPPVMN